MAKEEKAVALPGPVLYRPKYEVPNFDLFFGEDISGLACMSNDNVQEGDGRLRYQAALGRGLLTAGDLEAAPLNVAWFYVFRVPTRDDDGQIVGAHYRVVLMGKDGHTFETHAEGSVDTLRQWVAEFGWSRWDPAVPVKLAKRVSRANRTYHQLYVAGGAAVPAVTPPVV